MSYFKHVQLHEYELTNAGISQACYDELVASGNNSTEEQLRALADIETVSYTHLTLPTNREV